MPFTVPRNHTLKTLEDDGFHMVPRKNHEDGCAYPFLTCREMYCAQFFLHMTSPTAIKAFNEKFKAQVPEYTMEELEVAWVRTKEIFESAWSLYEFDTWEALVESVPNLSDESIKAMLKSGHLIRGYFRGVDPVKTTLWAHVQPQMRTARAPSIAIHPDLMLHNDALDLCYDMNRDYAVWYLSGQDIDDNASVRLAGLPMFRELALTGSWDIHDSKMFGRPELALFLYKALDNSKTQCLMKEPIEETQAALKTILECMPQNMQQDLKANVFDYFQMSLE